MLKWMLQMDGEKKNIFSMVIKCWQPPFTLDLPKILAATFEDRGYNQHLSQVT